MSVVPSRAQAGLTSRAWSRLNTLGPGILVMLAYGDAGNVVVAAEGGARWGFRLLPVLLVTTPLIYMLQELAVRLGIFTGRGHGEILRDVLGVPWTWISAGGLVVAAVGTIIAQFTAIAGVGEMFHVPRMLTVPMAAVLLLAVVASDAYRRVERIALALGLCGAAFIVVAWCAHPRVSDIVQEIGDLPVGRGDFLYLAAAMIGAVLNTWMVFYQQSAVIERGLGPKDYGMAKWDTAIGAGVTQILTASVMISTASTLGEDGFHGEIGTIGSIAKALTPFLGQTLGQLVFAVGVIGACSVAAAVASLALVWGISEVTGHRHSFERQPLRARGFLSVFAVLIGGCAVLVVSIPDLVWLNIGTQVVSAFLLPMVIALLVWASLKALPPERKLGGLYLATLVAGAVLVSGIGVAGGIYGMVAGTGGAP